jgi:serine O-acetyltransferase
VIRALVDRLESLEQQLQELQNQQPAHASTPAQLVAANNLSNVPAAVAPSCRLKDGVIQQFLDGAGI